MAKLPRFEVRSRVLHDLRLSAGARLAYMLLDDLAWQDGTHETTQVELADRLGFTARSLERYLRELKEAKVLEVERGGPRAARYLLSWRSVDRAQAKPERLATHGGSSAFDPPPMADHLSKLADQSGAYKSLGNQRIQIDQRERLTDEEASFTEWLDSYPGVEALPGRAPVEIVRRCLAVGTYSELTAALREMSHSRLKPTKSWAWFPVVLAQRRKKTA